MSTFFLYIWCDFNYIKYSMNNFVPLHIVSCYSFLQSGLTIEKIQASVVKNDYFGMGLCDNGVMFGVPSFVKASEQAKRPYIIGLET